jgi:uncharacterized spore protein YtfJ
MAPIGISDAAAQSGACCNKSKNIHQLLESMAERVSGRASVKMVYGDPITAGDCTVVPVAAVRYAFGGGGGGARGDAEAQNAGGGGRVSVWPCGALEITPEGSRFVEFEDSKRTAAGVAVGFVLGLAVALLVSGARE